MRGSLGGLLKALALGLALPSAGALAQSPEDARWNVHVGLAALRIGHGQTWGRGPELQVQRNTEGKWSWVGRVSAPVLGTDGGGVAIDVGPTLRSLDDNEEFGISFGPTFIPVREGSAIGSVFGGFASVYVIGWFGRRFGLMGESVLRVTVDGSSYPGLALGLALRL
jgi:hypothetical protein